MQKNLVLGGAASGKSLHAEKLALATGRPKLYVATASSGDEEMAARIARHVARRDASWHMREEPLEIAQILLDPRWKFHVILIDCLTLWLSHVMGDPAQDVQQRSTQLCEAVKESEATLIMVSNEIGLGGVPMHPVTRRFCDEAGKLHQQIAEQCDTVTFVAAGLPMMLKS